MFGRRRGPDPYPQPYTGVDWAGLADYLRARIPLLDAHADPMFRPREHLVTIELLDPARREDPVLRRVQLLGVGPSVTLQACTRDGQDGPLLEAGWARFEPAGGPSLLACTQPLDGSADERILDLTITALQAAPAGPGSPILRVTDTAYRPQPAGASA